MEIKEELNVKETKPSNTKDSQQKSSSNWTWCKSCCKSHNQKVKHHIRSEKHKERLLKLLNDEMEKINTLRHFASNVTKVPPTQQNSKPFHCFCCEIDVPTDSNKFVG